MSLTKAEIASTISDVMFIEKKKAIKCVEMLLEIIKSTLESGEDVMVSGFGKFCVNEKRKRKGRNPATGEDLMLPAKKECDVQMLGEVETANE